jgi:hypothetical protein
MDEPTVTGNSTLLLEWDAQSKSYVQSSIKQQIRQEGNMGSPMVKSPLAFTSSLP